MKTAAKWIGGVGGGAVVLCSVAYFVLFRLGASPTAPPNLSAELQLGAITMASDGVDRTFLYFVPRDLAPSPGLLLAFHGGGGDSEQMRAYTAYEFDEIADAEGLIVAYPQGYDGHWNTCQAGRTNPATERDIDDVGFARALVEWFEEHHDIDRSRVFAVGFSNGGHMCYRLALEVPDLFAGVAVLAANQPVASDSKCTSDRATSPLMIINGVDDPINPHAGGELSFYGLRNFGPVMSTQDTALSFARAGQASGDALNQVRSRDADRDGDPESWVERTVWGEDAHVTVLAVHGSGHSISQPTYHFPIVFGPTTTELDAPVEIWNFFEHHN